MTDWISVAYDFSVPIGAFLVSFVMVKTQSDRINSVAPTWLNRSRNWSFTLMAALIINGFIQDASRLSFFLIYLSGLIALLLNAIALFLRTHHPQGGATSGVTYSSPELVYDLAVSIVCQQENGENT